jgi:hypothetical protein
MGGYGSGRWHWHSAKQTVEDGLSLPTTHIRKALNDLADGGTVSLGSLHWSRAGKELSSIGYRVSNEYQRLLVSLFYTTTHRDGSKTNSDYFVEVVATTPTFGGRRWWWICPLVKDGRPCRRRVAKLYLPPGATFFGCRHCYELTYTSCNESHKYDSLWKGIADSVNHDRGLAPGQGFRAEDVGRLLRNLGKAIDSSGT